MTCIVGIQTSSGVWIGGDSAAVAGDSINVRADEKVFFNGEFLFGFCGSFRVGNLIRYAFTPPSQSCDDDMSFLVNDVVDAMRTLQRDRRAIRRMNEETHESDSSFLVAYKGRLYSIETDYQIAKPLEGYAAIGSGADVAMGALAATEKMRDPRKRVLLALEAAARHCTGVRGPFIALKSS